MENQQQSQNLFLKVDQRPITTFFNLEQTFLLLDKLIRQPKKRETSNQNLRPNNVAQKVGGFCVSYFVVLTENSLFEPTFELVLIFFASIFAR